MSPLSFIRCSAFPAEYQPSDETPRRLKANGGQLLKINSAADALITFRLIPVNSRLLIVPDKYMAIDVLLGRDFVEARKISLRTTKLFRYSPADLNRIKSKTSVECTPDLCSYCKMCSIHTHVAAYSHSSNPAARPSTTYSHSSNPAARPSTTLNTQHRAR